MGRAGVIGCRLTVVVVLGVVASAGLGPGAGPACAESRIDTSVAPPPSFKPRVPLRRPVADPPVEDTAEPPQPNPWAPQVEEEQNEDEPPPQGGALTPSAGAPLEPQQPLDGVIDDGAP